MKDKIYQKVMGEVIAFEFDEEVTRVFPDMIERSVPGYQATLSAAGALAHRLSISGTRIYELGCSRGAALLSMDRAIPKEVDVTLIGVDQSQSMLSACRADLIDSGLLNHPLNLIQQDIRTVEMKDASLIVLNFTLQFIPIEDRLPLLRAARQALRPGGALLLSEKVKLADDRIDSLCIDLHHEFKKSQGYSELEIARKRDALVGVLIPEQIQTHKDRLSAAGFSASEVWYQAFNFCSLVALA
jgi:tRNA (cmo5U34)-methyltransferase